MSDAPRIQVAHRRGGDGRAGRSLARDYSGLSPKRACLICLLILPLVLGCSIWPGGSSGLALAQAIIALSAVSELRRASGSWGSCFVVFQRPKSHWGWGTSAGFLVLTFIALLAGPAGSMAQAVSRLQIHLSHPSGLMAVLWAPAAEEMFFRAVLLGSLLPLWPFSPRHGLMPTALAVYAAACVFLVFHLPVDLELWQTLWAQGAVPLHLGAFFLGIWTGGLLVMDRSIIWPIAVHALANLLAPVWDLVLFSAS